MCVFFYARTSSEKRKVNTIKYTNGYDHFLFVVDSRRYVLSCYLHTCK